MIDDNADWEAGSNLRHSLRFRIVAAFVTAGLLMGLLFGGVVYGYLHTMEDQVAINIMTLEVNTFAEKYRLDRKTPPPDTLLMKGYVVNPQNPQPFAHFAEIHSPWAKPYEVGDYELDHDHHLMIKDLVDGQALYLFRSTAGVDPLEEVGLVEMLLLNVGIVVLLSGWFGFLIAKRMLAPVVNLAEQVAETRPEQLPLALNGPFYQDEVGDLAQALQNAMDRIAQFIEREQRFTRDASHELRTPVTVIKGAVELMDKQLAAGKPTASPPRRIKRAVLDMENIIETFLYLGREGDSALTEGDTPVETVAENLIEANRYLLEEKDVSARLVVEEKVRAQAPESVVTIAVGNLIRNAFQYTDKGEVLVTVGNDAVTVRDSGPGINRHQLTLIQERDYRGGKGDGFGLGLAIVRDFCQRRGWALEFQSEPGQGTLVQLRFKS